MASELQGELGEGVVENILQFLGLNNSTGCLLLNTPTQQGKVFLEKGRVAHVCAGNLRDIPALATQLLWQEGNFSFDPSIPIPEKTIRLAVDKLLLKAYQSDLSDLNKAQLQSQSQLGGSSILISSPQERVKTTVEINIHALKILPLLNGKRTLSDVAKDSSLSLERVLATSKKLIERGLAENKGIQNVNKERVFKLWHNAFAELEAYFTAKKLGNFQVMWTKAANILAKDYPCLDPFMPELKYTQSGLVRKTSNLDDGYPKALLAVTRQLAKTYKLSSNDLSRIMKVNSETLTSAELEVSGLIHLLH